MSLSIDPQQFEDYETKDLVYKDQARQLICENLGYEPPLKVSVLSELYLRNALKRHEEGEKSKESLQDYIDFQVTFIKRLMMERIETYTC